MRATITALLTVVTLAAAPVAAQRTAYLDPDRARDHWTPQRVLQARPMPMPALDLSQVREDREFVAARAAEPAVDHRPAEPTARITPDFDRRLYRAGLRPNSRASRPTIRFFDQPGAEFTAINRGTFGLDFSSSRLVPEDSRLAYPYSAVGRLFMSFGNQDFVCSAAVISARVLVTAGHCLFDGGGFADSVLFVPAYHSGEAPFGAWAAETLIVTDEWAASEEIPNDADFGMVVVSDLDLAATSGGVAVPQKIGNVTGWLGFKTGALFNNHVTMLGYPNNFDRGEQMHRVDSSDLDTGAASPAVIYGGDMRGGASGGPWVQNFGVAARGQKGGKNKAPNRIVGVSSFTATDQKLRVLGSSEFNASARDAFNEACADSGGNCAKKGKPNKK